LVLTSGLPGTGKSSTDTRLAQLISEKLGGSFSAENIIDNFLDMIKFVKNANPNEVHIAVVEEISVLFPSRRAMSGDNVDVGKLLDTCRKKKVIILANAPLWTSIDSHMKALANIYIETIKIYRMAGIVYSKCYKLQTNPATGKTYTHNFKRKNKDVNRMYTLPPGKEIWDAYENKKDAFLDELYSKAEARALQRKAKDNKLLQQKGLHDIKPRDMNIFIRKQKGEKTKDLSKEFGMTERSIQLICKNVGENKHISLGNSVNRKKKPHSEPNNIT
jgi:hypothetical protein